jgi:hypothetical protein
MASPQRNVEKVLDRIANAEQRCGTLFPTYCNLIGKPTAHHGRDRDAVHATRWRLLSNGGLNV